MFKFCTRCNTEKSINEFHKNRKTKDGLCWLCKKCANEATGKWSYKSENLAKKKKWRQSDNGKISGKRANLKRKYGITIAQEEEMLIKQEWKCANKKCVNPAEHVDHCHVSGKVRGMLCKSCNHALGLVQDSRARLSGLITYLEET